MPDYLEPIAHAEKNLVVSHDGSVYANYLLRGVNINPYEVSAIVSAQQHNEALFTALSAMASSDIYLGGIKVRTPPEELVQRFVAGLRAVTNEQYPELRERIALWHHKFTYGEYVEFRRMYFLSVKLPVGNTSGAAKAFAKAGVVNPMSGLDWDKVARLENSYWQQIPQVFAPRRASTAHLYWMHERMRLRGLEVPTLPAEQTAFTPKGFSQVMINKVADTEPVLDAFIRDLNPDAPQKLKTGRRAEFSRNYRSARQGQALAVHSPELRSDALPDGPAALQSLLAVSGFPRQPKAMINSFLYLADQDTGADVDFALRMTFDQELISVEHQRGFKSVLGAEEKANVTDEYDLSEYRSRAAEASLLHQQVGRESSPRGMKVAAVFAFAHPHRETLGKVMAGARQRLESNDFAVLHPVAGQFDLLKQMLPCVRTSPLMQDLMGATTVRKFSACIPVRRTEIGDSIGIPFAINKENALGQIGLLDLTGATDKGSGSLAITGAQGKGKSYEVKNIIDWLTALRCPNTIIDQGGEYLAFARSQGPVQVVEVKRPKVSCDVLKVFADDPQLAKQVFMELMRALCGFAEGSDEMLLLSRMLDPRMRERMHIHSSRALIALLDSGRFSDSEGHDKALAKKLKYWANIGYTAAMFDPIDETGRVTELPAYQRSADALSVVFVTDGLPIHRGELTPDTDSLRRYSVVVHTLLAWITTYDFKRNRSAPIRALIADEVAFMRGSKALEELIGSPDKTGRKEGNIVVAAGQLATYFDDDSFRQIRKKVALGQQTTDNARDALVWADMPPTERLVNRMVSDTSPPDPDHENKPMRGREGEGWWNDGFGNIARVQMLPMVTAAGRKHADTTSSVYRAVALSEEAAESAPTGRHAGAGQPMGTR